MFLKKLNKDLKPLYWLFLPVFVLNCNGNTPDEDLSLWLSDLEVTVEITGASTTDPHGDGSGKIDLSFSAKNATSYKVNFGNGESIKTSSKIFPILMLVEAHIPTRFTFGRTREVNLILLIHLLPFMLRNPLFLQMNLIMMVRPMTPVGDMIPEQMAGGITNPSIILNGQRTLWWKTGA